LASGGAGVAVAVVVVVAASTMRFNWDGLGPSLPDRGQTKLNPIILLWARDHNVCWVQVQLQANCLLNSNSQVGK